MGDRTVAGLWYRWPKKIFDLGRRRAGIVFAPEPSPVRNQDRGADARRISCAGVTWDEWLACAIARWGRERSDRVSRDRVHVLERSVQRGSQVRRRRQGDGGREDGEGGHRELQKGLCASAKFPTGDKVQYYDFTNFELVRSMNVRRPATAVAVTTCR
jgi:hypothetical protein